MRFRKLAIALAIVLMTSACCTAAVAQMGAAAPAPAPGTAISPAKALDDMLNLFASEIVPAAKAMPADKYDFAPSAAIFAPDQSPKFDTVRTFGNQVTHVAEANFYFYSTLSGLRPDVDMKALQAMTKSPTTKKEDAVKVLEQSIAFAHKAIATITVANAFESIKGVDGMTTRATVAAFGVAHGYDHYGQMVEYLRMNGVVPPASAK
jgi:uncharacterized damage-inducible protein DinB